MFKNESQLSKVQKCRVKFKNVFDCAITRSIILKNQSFIKSLK